MGNLQLPNDPTFICLDCGRKREHRKDPHVKKKKANETACLLDVVFIQLTVHSTDAHVLHHLNTTVLRYLLLKMMIWS